MGDMILKLRTLVVYQYVLELMEKPKRMNTSDEYNRMTRRTEAKY